jgi:hypothetical protein
VLFPHQDATASVGIPQENENEVPAAAFNYAGSIGNVTADRGIQKGDD